MRSCLATVLAGATALAVAACGDNERHAEWSQLSFPEGVTVTEPIERPSKVTNVFGRSAIAVGPSPVNGQELTMMMRLHLAADGWDISGRNREPPGFFADAPDSIDVAFVEPIEALERDPRWLSQDLRRQIAATPGASRGVVVSLAPTEQQPD